jgi:hypothetical protein
LRGTNRWLPTSYPTRRSSCPPTPCQTPSPMRPPPEGRQGLLDRVATIRPPRLSHRYGSPRVWNPGNTTPQTERPIQTPHGRSPPKPIVRSISPPLLRQCHLNLSGHATIPVLHPVLIRLSEISEEALPPNPPSNQGSTALEEPTQRPISPPNANPSNNYGNALRRIDRGGARRDTWVQSPGWEPRPVGSSRHMGSHLPDQAYYSPGTEGGTRQPTRLHQATTEPGSTQLAHYGRTTKRSYTYSTLWSANHQPS